MPSLLATDVGEMRNITGDTALAWTSGDYVGSNRPLVRATIVYLQNLIVPVVEEIYASVIYGQYERPVELPNIKSCTWKKAVDQDAATMTMVLYNQAALPIGDQPELNNDFELAGYYTPSRGTGGGTTRWAYTTNLWQGRIIPDAVIRTYEGYGFNAEVGPEDDVHMYPSGIWRIDDVDFNTDFTITVTARGIESVLIDQILMPPIVPFNQYPLKYTAYHDVANPPVQSGSVSWVTPTYSTDSGRPYVGQGGTVYGHHGSDAFDANNATYWLSIGNQRPDQGYSYEYVEGKLASSACGAVKAKVWGGPYTMYVSVFSNGAWAGSGKIPYDPHNPASAPNGSDIPFVWSGIIGSEAELVVNFTKAFPKVTKVRVTFTNLYNSRIGQYPYRAGVRHFQASVGTIVMVDGGTHTEGNYGDFTDIVKKLLAWGGWYWPNDTALAVTTASDGDVDVTLPPSDDAFLGKGRVWGDFLESGTFAAGVAADGITSIAITMGTDVWDQKPIMTGITYVRDLLGFIFFVDDTGGAVFRMPNIWALGNWVGDTAADAGRTSQIIDLDETMVITKLNAKLSSRNIRESVFVGNITGRFGAISTGFLPPGTPPTGLRRVGGWTDQNFGSDKECQVMADLIALRMYFQYRTDQVEIAANPAIQIDDQVRIWERVSNETFVHYVQGIDMSWDLETGSYKYTLTTYWLGDTAFDNWAFKPSDFSASTQAFLTGMGVI
jgi:hypothetical protein